MSDVNGTSGFAPRPKQDEVIEDAVVVDDATGRPAQAQYVTEPVQTEQPMVVEQPVVVEEATVSETEPVIATTDPAAAEVPGEPAQRVVYVHVPPEPKKLSNRALGTVVALVAAIVFTILLAVITALIGAANGRPFSFGFLGRAEFYIPTLFFVVAFVLLVVLVNRANWWAYIVGSLVVAVVVYFGTIGLTLLTSGVVQQTPDQAALSFRVLLGNPFIIGSALLAREVALWSGGIISRRGRRLRLRNVENRAAYDRELATTRAEHERAAATATAAG